MSYFYGNVSKDEAVEKVGEIIKEMIDLKSVEDAVYMHIDNYNLPNSNEAIITIIVRNPN